jgi:hypothetical protein
MSISLVMAGLDPAIQKLTRRRGDRGGDRFARLRVSACQHGWMAASRAAMTKGGTL